MSTSYSDVCIGVNSVHQASENFHQKTHTKQHKFYKSSMDLLGLLLFFNKRGGFHGKTSYLALKMKVSERAIYKSLDLLQEQGFITRTKVGRQRLITCLIPALPIPLKKQKVQSKAKAKVQSLQLREEELRQNTNNVDVVKALQEQGVKLPVAHSLAKKFSRERIREVINASRKQSDIKNKAGFIVKGLASSWTFASKVEEPPRYPMFVRPTEVPNFDGGKDGIAMIKARIARLNRS